uniref:Uncharacterized protein n=1 Tax=Medicago truncatula TaxID=3880 RepID=I3SBL6_MEDTR|nr:unknown [Medicago truncatula]
MQTFLHELTHLVLKQPSCIKFRIKNVKHMFLFFSLNNIHLFHPFLLHKLSIHNTSFLQKILSSNINLNSRKLQPNTLTHIIFLKITTKKIAVRIFRQTQSPKHIIHFHILNTSFFLHLFLSPFLTPKIRMYKHNPFNLHRTKPIILNSFNSNIMRNVTTSTITREKNI